MFAKFPTLHRRCACWHQVKEKRQDAEPDRQRVHLQIHVFGEQLLGAMILLVVSSPGTIQPAIGQQEREERSTNFACPRQISAKLRVFTKWPQVTRDR
jgi:hypothetical protein